MKSLFTKQLVEAALWTFLETFLATLTPALAATTMLDWKTLPALCSSAGVAALAAVLSLVKSYVVKNLGGAESIFIAANDKEVVDGGE